MVEKTEKNESNIHRINNARSFEEAIKIAMEDEKFDQEELTTIYEKYRNKSKDLYQLYVKQFCDTKNQTECNLNDLQLEMELRILAKTNPNLLFENLESFINQPWAKEILLEATKNNPSLAFKYFYKYKDQIWVKEVLLKAIINNSFFAFYHFDEYKDQAWTKEVLLEATKNNPSLAFRYFYKYKDQAWAKEILDIIKNKEVLLKAIINDPSLAFDYFDEYKNQVWAKEVLLEATKNIPSLAFNYFNGYKDQIWAKEVLLEAIKKRPFFAFNYYNMYKGEPWAKDIIKFAIQEINNMQEKNYLYIAYIINVLHNEDEKLRFAIIEGYPANELYKVITKGREEVFTSTYNGIITRFLEELNKTGKDIYDVAQENNFENISVFLEAAASYGRIEELLNTIKSDEKKKELINHLFENLGNDLVRNSVAIMEIINALKDKKIIDFILFKLEEEYNKGGESKNAIGIIAKFASEKYKTPFLNSLPKEYELPKINGVPNKELFDDKGRNIQQYYFYNDEDGKNSFKSFIDKYKSDTKWKIEEKESYVKITSINSKGRHIIIYGNKPEFDGSDNKKGNGIESISSEMKRNNQVPTLVAHRGHSYHSMKTIEKLTSENKLVFLGSCGGFQNIGATLENSPKSQIISTKGTGTMLVNDPLFKHINDDILEGRDINWGKIWSDISKQVGKNPNFEKYVRPDQNLGALFFDKYKSLSK